MADDGASRKDVPKVLLMQTGQSKWNTQKSHEGVCAQRHKNIWDKRKTHEMLPIVLGAYSVHAQVLSHVQLFVIPWTAAFQAPLSMGFSG